MVLADPTNPQPSNPYARPVVTYRRLVLGPLGTLVVRLTFCPLTRLAVLFRLTKPVRTFIVRHIDCFS
jgi:hypothetical protein